jgi:hypothetical protein
MRVAFFTESQYLGKIPREHLNLRTELTWMVALGASHIPINRMHEIPAKQFDIGIVIIPKRKDYLLEFPLVNEMSRLCNTIGAMQEGTCTYWQDNEIVEQIWYFNTLTEMDIIFAHNDNDRLYYEGLTGVRTELLHTLMITDYINQNKGHRSGVMMGGNMVQIYGGFDSYQVALELDTEVHALTTGRMKPEEELLDIVHHPWMDWSKWIELLGTMKYGIQMGTPSAGTFNLNCAYHGIPCIGYSNVNTQLKLHPYTTVEPGDIAKAKEIARRLKSVQSFYDVCSRMTKQLYDIHYSEEAFLRQWEKSVKGLI